MIHDAGADGAGIGDGAAGAREPAAGREFYFYKDIRAWRYWLAAQGVPYGLDKPDLA